MQSTPKPTKKDNVIVDNQGEKRQVAVGLRAGLKETPLEQPVEDAADGIGPLCNRAKTSGVLLDTEAKAKVEVYREGDC